MQISNLLKEYERMMKAGNYCQASIDNYCWRFPTITAGSILTAD
jgi:hypothetical protein